MKRYIRKIELAKGCGVTRSAIAQATRPGSELHDAVGQNGKIDIDHPNVVAYIKKKGGCVEPLTEEKPKLKQKAPRKKALKKIDDIDLVDSGFNAGNYLTEQGSPKPDIPIIDITSMTLDQIMEIFGTDENFKTYLTARKTLVDIEEKEIKNAEKRGELVSKALVQSRIIDQFNRVHLLLLKDGAKSISAGVASKIESGDSLQAAEVYVSEVIGSFIKPLKAKISSGLGQ